MSIPTGFIIDTPAGRLVTTRAVKVRSVEEGQAIRAAVVYAIKGRELGAVVCTDWRDIDVFAPEIADVLLDMFRSTNSWLTRGGILVPSGRATFGLQLERMLREADHPARRAFRDVSTMLAWLGEVLTPVEVRHAAEFLARSKGDHPVEQDNGTGLNRQ